MDVPAGVTQEEGHTGFLIHLPSAVRVRVSIIVLYLSLLFDDVFFFKKNLNLSSLLLVSLHGA